MARRWKATAASGRTGGHGIRQSSKRKLKIATSWRRRIRSSIRRFRASLPMWCMPDKQGLHVENDAARTPLPLIRLAAADVGQHRPLTANVQLTFGNRLVDLELILPADPV